MALVIVLSVFNGFEELILSLFNAFNPDIEITAARGKYIDISNFPTEKVKSIPGVKYYTEALEENVLLRYQSKQMIAVLKGVSPDFFHSSRIADYVIDGECTLEHDSLNFALVGAGIAYELGINLNDIINPVEVYVPNAQRFDPVNSLNAFSEQNVFASGVFSIQQDFDSKYFLTPLSFAKKLLGDSVKLSQIELGLAPGVSQTKIVQSLKTILGNDYVIKNRYQQQEFIYKVMKSEKWFSFLILVFILIIALFTLIGSVSMLIIDKQKDINVLWSLGSDYRQLKLIFLLEGLMITLLGTLVGLALGFLVCWLQIQFGWVKIASASTFVVQSYPVKIILSDFLLVFVTVICVSFLAILFPVRKISQNIIKPIR